MLTKANLEYDEEVIKSLYGWGFGMKRQAISRAISSLKDKEVTLENIPEEVALLSDGTTFVHEQDQELHVYYSEKTIEMACTNGLYAIVADGVHTKQPKELMQLYCVHGVCNGGVEVPLLYSMTARKTEDVYLRIFGHLKNLFERRRDTCNLRKFVQGHGRVPVVAEWWDTIKGVVFLPKRLYPEVRALWRPPVPEDHVAYEKCKEFLEYLHSTWFDGPYKDLWNKWELVDLRTTNIAEAYHNRLNVEFGRDHPDLRTLIEKLKYIDFEAKCSLQWIREHPNEEKHLRKRDRERRQNIETSMKSFGERYLRGVTRAQIEEYCKYMSRYVSGKTI
uniref:MULE domain-containing protein n=1 Tax=Haemonchus contortus TaxID=6289 RepID=A0A7I4YCF8_HAECO